MSLEDALMKLARALPEQSRRHGRTVRDVCLTYHGDGEWSVMAGGHPAVHIGEWGGDFSAEGATADEAIANCLRALQADAVGGS